MVGKANLLEKTFVSKGALPFSQENDFSLVNPPHVVDGCCASVLATCCGYKRACAKTVQPDLAR